MLQRERLMCGMTDTPDADGQPEQFAPAENFAFETVVQQELATISQTLQDIRALLQKWYERG